MENKDYLNFERVLKEVNEELQYKKDYIINPKSIHMNENGMIHLNGEDTMNWGYQLDENFADRRFANKLGIPVNYFNNMDNHLKAYNVNYLIDQMDRDADDWFIRTKEYGAIGMIRGLFSKKYVPYDNHELLDQVKQVVDHRNDTRIERWVHNEKGFHLVITFDELTESIGKTIDGTPDYHKVGILIENSEIGWRSVKVRPMVFRLICSNGMIIGREEGEMFRQKHIGIEKEGIQEQVAATMEHAFKAWGENIKILSNAKSIEVENVDQKIKDIADKNKGFGKGFVDHMKESFDKERGNNMFYLAQAMTDAAKKYDEDTRIKIEKEAGDLIRKTA